jgi:predicted NUDIX family NTP pyrophosphohydrolase
MATRSAGILLFRRTPGGIEVLLVHPGGPLWQRRHAGAWTIPKGEFAAPEAAEDAARREFHEETGCAAPELLVPLGEVRQKAGKAVVAFAAEGAFDVGDLVSNTFEIEWPPRSGLRRSFPEIDRAEWLTLAEARLKINAAQVALLDKLEILAGSR